MLGLLYKEGKKAFSEAETLSVFSSWGVFNGDFAILFP